MVIIVSPDLNDQNRTWPKNSNGLPQIDLKPSSADPNLINFFVAHIASIFNINLAYLVQQSISDPLPEIRYIEFDKTPANVTQTWTEWPNRQVYRESIGIMACQRLTSSHISLRQSIGGFTLQFQFHKLFWERRDTFCNILHCSMSLNLNALGLGGRSVSLCKLEVMYYGKKFCTFGG